LRKKIMLMVGIFTLSWGCPVWNWCRTTKHVIFKNIYILPKYKTIGLRCQMKGSNIFWLAKWRAQTSLLCYLEGMRGLVLGSISQFHPSSIWMMIHLSIYISLMSLNGTILQEIVDTHTKEKGLKSSNCAP